MCDDDCIIINDNKLISEYTIDPHKCVAINTNGKLILADCTNPLHAGKVIGITTERIKKNLFGKICILGLVKGFTGLLPGYNYYLYTNGNISIYNGYNSFIQCVGVAISATSLLFRMDMAILEVI